MSLFEDASLVMIPSGYKVGKVYSIKPSNGDGDLTFSRSNDTATRVNSDGLIEKVRTNLLTYSQDFTNPAWTKSNVSATGGQTDPNGGTTASLVQTTIAVSAYFYQTQSGAKAFSIYAKAGTRNNFSIINGIYNNGASFNLSTQTATSAGAGSLAKIEDVGGGWYRCSVYVSTSSDMIIMPADVSGGGMNVGDNLYFAFAQAETGDIATDYIATTTAAVSVGPVADLPRLDYLDSSCPKLLLEPQRTNLVTYSEQFDNAAWIKLNISATANQATSPDGYTNADALANTSTTDAVDFYKTFTTTAASVYTLSCFAKSGTFTKAVLRFYSGQGGGQETQVPAVTFDLDNGVVLNEYGLVTDSSITSYGNGWYRLTLTAAAVGTTGYGCVLPLSDTATWNTAYQYPSNFGSLGNIQVYGFQAELASYETSYIPTLSAASTRGADAASKTGISSLIGQTEGTLFVEAKIAGDDASNRRLINVSDGTTANRIEVYAKVSSSQLELAIRDNGVDSVVLTSSSVGLDTTFKIAVAYASNDCAYYVNGTLVGTDSSVVVPSTSKITFGRGDGNFLWQGEINQALLFKTRLSNAELEALTQV